MKSSGINNTDFILVQGFMLKELQLKGSELLVYAVIYGFSKDGIHKFYGSRSYIAEWTGISVSNVQKNLNSLVNKELIIKHEVYRDNVKYCEYEVNQAKIKIGWGVAQNSLGVDIKQDWGRNKIGHNNIDNNINNKIDINNIYSDFEKIIKQKYVGKKTKAVRDKVVPKLLKKYSVEELTRVLERYASECKGKDSQYILNESTFWNGRYMDYLDENYEDNVNPKKTIHEDNGWLEDF